MARFTAFATAGGLIAPALGGTHPVLGVCGLAGSLLLVLVAAGARQAARARTRDSPRMLSLVLVTAILLVGLSAGYLFGAWRVLSLVASDLEQSVGLPVKAELVVTGAVRSFAGWRSAPAAVIRMDGAVDSSAAAGERVLLEVPPAFEDGRGAATRLAQGAIVSVRGSIQAPRGPTATGFDQARQLLHQGIKVVLQADTHESINVIGHRGGVAGWFDRLRASAAEHLSRGPNQNIGEVLRGVVMGDTAGIDEDWLEAFRRSGTAHMLSVSGLHVASLAAIMLGFARLLRAPRWAGFVLAAAAAVLLIPLVGSSAPVVRSAVMIVIVLLGRWVGRGRDQWQVLALAAVVVLALNPYAVFDVGFQLSFAAFVGMLVLLGPLTRMLGRLPAAIGSNVAVSLAASLGTAPVALVVFGKTSLVSPLANLLVVPTLPFVTGLGMASVFLGFIWHGLSTALDTLASVPLMWTVLVARLMAVAPVLGAGSLGRAVCAVAIGAAAVPVAMAVLGRPFNLPLGLRLPLFAGFSRWARHRRPRDRRLALWLAVFIVGAGVAAGAAVYPLASAGAGAVRVAVGGRHWPSEVELRVLDVGQGNAVLLRTPQRRAVLFDGGPAGCDLAGQLHSLGVDRLDLVVVSHPHADHFAGLAEALDGVEVKRLIDHVEVIAGDTETGEAGARASPAEPSRPEEAEAYVALRRRVAAEGGSYALASSGSVVQIDGVTVRFFAPADPLVLREGSSPWGRGRQAPSGDELNAVSLVALLSAGAVDILLPGDAEAVVLQRYDLPPSEVVVVPHHGSRGAVTAALLAGWGTEAALVSVGKDNTFGHPDETTLALLLAKAVRVVRTDRVGWVCCSVHGDDLVLSAEHEQSSTTKKTE